MNSGNIDCTSYQIIYIQKIEFIFPANFGLKTSLL